MRSFPGLFTNVDPWVENPWFHRKIIKWSKEQIRCFSHIYFRLPIWLGSFDVKIYDGFGIAMWLLWFIYIHMIMKHFPHHPFVGTIWVPYDHSEGIRGTVLSGAADLRRMDSWPSGWMCWMDLLAEIWDGCVGLWIYGYLRMDVLN